MPSAATRGADKAPNVREAAIDAATRLFARQGFDGTSLQAIADEVGVRKPSLLYHFASKDALRLAVLDKLMGHWNEVLPQVLLAAARKDRFDATVEALIDFFLEDPDRARLLCREILDRPDDMAKHLATHVRPWIQVIAEQLRLAKEEGHVHRDADVPVYAVQVMHFVITAIAMRVPTASALTSGQDDVDRWRQEMLRIARAALFIKPTRPH